ncbi:hypothetical protein [Saccharopolyspora griseoalba]|uniref:DUF222 domain-containing protein n=1 Tax=Saccharopolyspora griseoalba TaxID=1431848 RepID=A0ABW2LPU5_9PSEU
MSEICPVHKKRHLPYEPDDMCWDGKHKHPAPVSSDPGVRTEHDEEGNPVDPSVGWNLSAGCNLSVGFAGEELAVTVSTSDADQRDGITHRAVTRDQVINHARHLLTLVGETPLLGRDTQVTLYTPGTYEGDAQVTAIGDAIEQMRDTADSVDIAHAAITMLRGETTRYAEERVERAGNSAIDDLAYRTLLRQRDEAIARANDAAAERAELIGIVCDGSSTCPSPRHVDGCFRSAPETDAETVDFDGLAIPDLTEGDARSFDAALAEIRPSANASRCSESECRRGECCHARQAAIQIDQLRAPSAECSCEQPHTNLYDGGITDLSCPVHGRDADRVENTDPTPDLDSRFREPLSLGHNDTVREEALAGAIAAVLDLCFVMDGQVTGEGDAEHPVAKAVRERIARKLGVQS